MELKCRINGEEVVLCAEPTARLRDVLYKAAVTASATAMTQRALPVLIPLFLTAS